MTKNRPPSQRQLKAGELIRRALADILAKENIRDPDLQGVSVTISEVRASPDLKHALVYAAPLGGTTGGGDIEKVIAALQRCSSFLRGRLGKEMEMKSTPRLKFIADRSFDTAEDMAKLLDQPKVKQDLE
jgi:ribosome-binding factor A